MYNTHTLFQFIYRVSQKNALLSLKAYNPGLEAAIGASRDSFGILWL